MKELRLSKGLTQLELAQLAKTSQPQIMRLEGSKRVLSKAWAERLAPHLGISAEELLFADQQLLPIAPKRNYASRLMKLGEVFDEDLLAETDSPSLTLERDMKKLAIGHSVEREDGVFIVEFGNQIRWVDKPWFIPRNMVCFAVQITAMIYHPHIWSAEHVIVSLENVSRVGRETFFCNMNREINDLSLIAILRGFDSEYFFVTRLDRGHSGEDLKLPREVWPDALSIVGRGG